MRSFLILLILGIVGIHAQIDLAGYKVLECIKELRVNKSSIHKLGSAKKGCLLACAFKKINKNGKSLYNHFAETVNRPHYINSEGESYDTTGELREKLLDKLNKCHEQAGNDDCKFMTCIDIYKSPFLEFMTT